MNISKNQAYKSRAIYLQVEDSNEFNATRSIPTPEQTISQFITDKRHARKA
jgi:hypothetical protein